MAAAAIGLPAVSTTTPEIEAERWTGVAVAAPERASTTATRAPGMHMSR
jgi:hypothetical protein